MIKQYLFALLFILIFSQAQTLRAEKIEEPTSKTIDFEKQIKPIFDAHCVDCHGEDEQEAKLRVDQRGSLLRGGDSGLRAIVLGKPEKSYLIELMKTADEDVRMPLGDDALSKEKIALLERWIKQGAFWPGQMDATGNENESDHWSLQPVVKPKVPEHKTVSSNLIDAFLFDELQKKKLDFNSPTDPRTLMRRVSITLVGLAPSPEQADAFVKDYETNAEVAYEKLVDKLLASKHFGERFAQHWLDVIRWSETSGSESNYYRKNAWYYRDYVIDAFNEDKPYDQFLKEQIAGDAFGEDAATGYLVAGPYVPGETVGRQEAAIKQARFDRLDEVLQTVATSTMAMTIGCARCHNHKFDPISIRDYYSMVAIFQDIEFDHRIPNLPAEHPRAIAGKKIVAQIEKLRDQLIAANPEITWSEAAVDHRKIHFPKVQAKKVKITFLNKAVYLDEVEIHTDRASNNNIAIGAAVKTSKIKENAAEPCSNLVDDRHTSFWGWKSKPGESEAEPWVEITFGKVETITRIDLSQNRFPHYATDYIEGFNTRVPNVAYKIEVFSGGKWSEVAHSKAADQLPAEQKMARKKFITQIESLLKRLDEEGPQPIFAGRFRAPVTTHVLHRGDPMSPRDEIVPAALSVIEGDLKSTSEDSGQKRRLAFANWLANKKNPLSTRVITNRLWHHVFGTGIVSTPGDFGTMGAAPTHPELLDWLTATFVEDGWSVKKMLKRLVMTRAFRQSSTPRADALVIDSQCQLLWRYPPRRVEAEVLRDSILQAAGTLDLKTGGPSYRIYNIKKRFQQWSLADNSAPHTWRRMLYQERMRGVDDKMFQAFDFPDCSSIREKRPVSTTPLQALNLLNGKLIPLQSKKLAQSIRETTDNQTEQVAALFKKVLGRNPTKKEQTVCEELVQQDNLESLARTLFNTNEFAFLN